MKRNLLYLRSDNSDVYKETSTFDYDISKIKVDDIVERNSIFLIKCSDIAEFESHNEIYLDLVWL